MRNLLGNDRLKSLANALVRTQPRYLWSLLLPISGAVTAIVTVALPSFASLPTPDAETSSAIAPVSDHVNVISNHSPFLSVVNQLTTQPLLFASQGTIDPKANTEIWPAIPAEIGTNQIDYLTATIPTLPTNLEPALPRQLTASSFGAEETIAAPKSIDTPKEVDELAQVEAAPTQAPISNQFRANSLELAQSQFVLSQVVRLSDIQDHWAEGFIAALASRQIVVGFPDGTFRPDASVTRAQYAAMLSRAFKQTPIRSGATFRGGTFSDVPSSYWAAQAIETAYENGFFQVKSGFFSPEQSLPRAQTLAILGDGLNYQVPSNPNQVLKVYFQDADQVSSDSAGLVAAAATNQVVVSYPDINFLKPNRTATRADAASFVHQALVKNGTIPPLDSDSLAASYIAGLRPTQATQSFSTPTNTAQTTPSPSAGDIRTVKDRLRAYQEIDNFGNIFKGSPAITIANPAAYGADDFLLFASATFQSRTRFTQQSDGALGLGIGLFNALETVGLELSYTAASFGNSRSFGSGGFNAKLHRAFEGDWAVAAGWNGFVTINDPFGDFRNSWYGSVTKVFRTSDSINDSFSRVAVTAGFGGGQFRPLRDVRNTAGVKIGNEPSSSVGVFGSVAVRVADPLTAIVEWTGQDLAVGLSVRPISDVNWTITPALRDLAGEGLDGTRFVLGTSFSIKF